jgi:hypothetical protein
VRVLVSSAFERESLDGSLFKGGRPMRPIIFAACMLAGACSGQGFDSPASPSTAVGAPGEGQTRDAVSLPFRGTFTGESKGVVNCPPTCPPTTVRITTKETGEATQLGHYTAIYEGEVDLATATATGTATLTAANGDELFIEYEGRETGFVPPNVSTVTMVATITGGTGRFAAATGTLTIVRTGTIDAATGRATGFGSFEGQISLNK